MKTAMQEIKSDLLTTIDTSNEALESIKDLRIKEACQKVVTLTLHHILKRIDAELLEKEKRQIVKAFDNGFEEMPYKNGEHFYNETYKSECICENSCRGFFHVKCKQLNKQETLEEASKKYTEYLYYKVDDVDEFNGEPVAVHNAFTEGAKWKEYQMIEIMNCYADDVMGGCTLRAKEWIEQFKKK